MRRRQFIETLSAPVFAACAVCMASCGKGGDSPNNGGGGGTPGGGGGGGSTGFTVDLGTKLLTVGSSLVQSTVIVVRLAAGNTPASFTAVQVNCTHEGASISFDANQNKFICPNHGSTFSTDGAVTLGPAATNLKKYNISISGSTMTVSP